MSVLASPYAAVQFQTRGRTVVPKHSLRGAGHVVLGTLYSRAHRIGLDGVSCLLDSLRKNVSFSFSIVVVVCVLVCFGGDFNIYNGLLLSFSYKLSNLLSDKFSGLCMQPRKTRSRSFCEGGS